MLRKNFSFYIFVILFLFITGFHSQAYASDYALNFSDTTSWEINHNSGFISLDNQYISVQAENDYTNMFPFIRSKHRIFPDVGSFDIKVDFKYLGSIGFGTGIAISPSEPQLNKTNIASNAAGYVLFNVWQDGAGLGVYSWVCPASNSNCSLPYRIDAGFRSNDFDRHSVLFRYDTDGSYRIFIDNEQESIFVSNSNQIRPYGLWIGNSTETGTYSSWSSFEIYEISVNDNLLISPIVIVPGMGASWDFDALLNGSSGGDWIIPDFVKVYDGLVNTFLNAGYIKDNNLYVYNYDWRKPVEANADLLKDYINSISLKPGQKINIVGHSMGGLVARAYAQKYFDGGKIDKVVLVGTPNLGTVKAYGIWEGAEIWDSAWWSKVALALTTHLGGTTGETEVQTVRRVVPSVKDMLPTYDFLVLNNSLIPFENVIQKNVWLRSLNDTAAQVDSLVTNIVSDYITNTKDTINVELPTFVDILLGKWEDGKPVDESPFNYSLGDGTVTKQSAVGPFSRNIDGVGSHIDLATNIDNIKLLLNTLGIDETKAVAGDSESIDFGKILVAILRSPGSLEICNYELTRCNDALGIYDSGYKLFILPNYTDDPLVARIKEQGLGNYSLHVGYLGNTARWSVYDGLLNKPGQLDYFNLTQEGDHIEMMKDKTGPTVPNMIGFHNPELACGGTTNQHFATVDWSDSIDESGVAGYDYYVDYPVNGTRGKWSTFLTSSEHSGSLNEGVHYINVRSKDRAGNVSEMSETCSITADWTKPEVVITSPPPGIYLPSQLPKLSYTATDNLDDDLNISITGFSRSNGVHKVIVRAIDNAGNTSQASVVYTIQSPPQTKYQCFLGGWKIFTLLKFKNQGDCVSYVMRSEKSFHNYFWWLFK